MVAGLAALTVGLMLVNFKDSGQRGSSQALAQAMAEELRQARGLAIASQAPVAVVFPGVGPSGAVPHTTSFYQLEGWTAPRVTRVRHLRGEFPGCSLFHGSWPLDMTQLHSAVGANAANPPILGDKWRDWDLSRWLPAPSRQDYCLVFTPDGRVRGNDLPTFDRAYHILVVNGVGSYSSASPPANSALAQRPAYFTPGLVGSPYTVAVDVAGTVSVHPGVQACLAGAVQEVRSLADTAPAAAGRRLDARVQPMPDVPQIEIRSTTPNPAAGTDVSVSPDGYITLRASVADTANSGERLYCVWQVTPNSSNLGAGPSDYSVATAPGRGAAMDWSPALNRWVSTWQWRPPHDGKGGDLFTLRLVIQDSSGTDLTAAIERHVSVCPPGEVYYSAGFTMAFFSNVQRMNPDGSGKRVLHTPPYSAANPCHNGEAQVHCSADGLRVAFGSGRDLPPGGIGLQTYITDREGSMTYRVSGPVGDACEQMFLSPLGNLVAYKQMIAGVVYLQVVNCDPNPARRSVLTVDNLGGDGGWFLGGNARRGVMANDRLTWDMRLDNPAQAGVLYYSKWDAPGLEPHLYRARIGLDSLGRPTLDTPGAPFASVSAGAYSPYAFTAVRSDGSREDLLLYTLAGGVPRCGFLRFGPPVQVGILEAGSATGDVTPVAFMEGDQLKVLVNQPDPANGFGRIFRYTPPFANTPAPDRREIAGPNSSVGGYNSFTPAFAPPKP